MSTKNRENNVIWVNPPYSANVVVKVGKHFLSLLGKHFPPHNKFHEIFKRDTKYENNYQFTQSQNYQYQNHY